MSFAPRIAEFERILAPIANRSVTLDELRFGRPPPPALDEAGIRGPVETLLVELVDAYAIADETERAALRTVIARSRAFAWAAAFPPAPPEVAFRRALLWHALRDALPDPRDTILDLAALVATARAAGVDVARIVEEMAPLCSDAPRGAFGSMRGLLLRAAGAS
jgi:hypothetical protein